MLADAAAVAASTPTAALTVVGASTALTRRDAENFVTVPILHVHCYEGVDKIR